MKKDLEISVTQAAKLLNSSGRTVVNYCTRGKLQGSKNPITGIWKINLRSVEKIMNISQCKSPK